MPAVIVIDKNVDLTDKVKNVIRDRLVKFRPKDGSVDIVSVPGDKLHPLVLYCRKELHLNATLEMSQAQRKIQQKTKS